MATVALPENAVLRSVDKHYTESDWDQMPHGDDRRYEIINGELWMSTAPSLFHEWVSQRINHALFAQLEETGVAFVFTAPVGVFMPGCDPVQPDLFVIRQDDLELLSDDKVRGVPTLLIEILSPGSIKLDMEIKRAAYARAGVPEFWIVRPKEQDVLLHTEPDGDTGSYLRTERVPPDAELVSPMLPFRAHIADFFAGARYRKS